MSCSNQSSGNGILSSAFRPPSAAYVLAKRAFDLFSCIGLLLITFPLLVVLGLLITLTSRGPLFHISDRVGRDNEIFKMLKFRTMRSDTPQMATHLMTDPSRFVTPVGSFLRKTSLDELPQLLNVIKGDMTVVGPRPALYNQDDLIALRTSKGLHKLVPGITGWAQTHGRDEIPIPTKVDLDEYYLKNQSIKLDIRILWLSVVQAFSGTNISH